MSDNPVQLFVASYDNDIGAKLSLKEIGESLEPGSSAIIAIAEDHVLDDLQRGIEGYERIARQAMGAEAVVAITAVGSGEDGGDDGSAG